MSTKQVVVSTIPTTVVVRDTSTTVVSQPPSTSTRVETSSIDVVVDSAMQRMIEVGKQGPGGPPGPKGDPGDITGTTDQLAEGFDNLYYTHDRAEAVAESVVATSMALHLAHPDPHPQYVDGDDILDGGNF